MCSVPSCSQFSASLSPPSLCSWLSLTSSPAPTTNLWGPQLPMLSTHLTRHSTLYIPPHYSRPQLLPGQKTSGQHSSISRNLAQLFLSLITERPTSISGFVSLPLYLFNLTEILLPFGVEVSSDHTQYISKTKPRWSIRTINVFANSLLLQLNTPKQKTHDGGFTAQVLGSYLIEKTARTLQQRLYERTIMVKPPHSLSNLTWTFTPASHSSQIPSQTYTTLLEHFNNVSTKTVQRRMQGRNL